MKTALLILDKKTRRAAAIYDSAFPEAAQTEADNLTKTGRGETYVVEQWAMLPVSQHMEKVAGKQIERLAN